MLIYLLVILFLASFIPAVREFLKKQLRILCMVFGVGFLLLQSIVSFYIYPKLGNLYQEMSLPLDYRKLIAYQVVSFIVCAIILIFGIKYSNFKSNKLFYFTFAILIISLQLLGITITAVIMPIYGLTK